MGKAVQLTIPRACHENWHTMTTAERGRHCMRCNKTVVDFTNMSDREILHHIAKLGGSSVCGRLHPDQLHRNIALQKESRWPLLKYFFQYSLPAFLISMKANGQTQLHQSSNTYTITKDIAGKQPVIVERVIIKGRVLDNEGLGLPGASVYIKGTSTGTTTDTQGYFSLEVEKKKKIFLLVSSVGFKTLQKKIKQENWPAEMQLQLKMSPAVMGQVIVTY